MRPVQQGFSYIGLLILIAIMGVALAATGDLWQTASRREKEAQLLFVGDQFRLAIKRYCNRLPGRVKQYPKSLADLLLDPRFPEPHRYLRRIWVDPVTGTADWGLVKGPNGEIYGVYSQSDAEPIKKANFSFVDSDFEGRTKYSEWQFTYLSAAQTQILPGQTAPPNQPNQPNQPTRPNPYMQPNPRTQPFQPFLPSSPTFGKP